MAIPIQESLPILKPVVEIKDGLVAAISEVEEVLYLELSDDNIEGGLGVKIKNKNRFFEGIEGMLDSFSEQDCCQLVGTSFSLELCFCLVFVPDIKAEVSDEEVESFRHHRACRDCAI